MPENYIITTAEKGNINISEDVIATVVSAAIAETEGVAGVPGSVSGEIAEIFGKKVPAKGAKIAFQDNVILVDAVIQVKYGGNIVSVAKKVQENVVSALESMTGLSSEVSVRVAGVVFDKA